VLVVVEVVVVRTHQVLLQIETLGVVVVVVLSQQSGFLHLI
jgi:hypothetical protein